MANANPKHDQLKPRNSLQEKTLVSKRDFTAAVAVSIYTIETPLVNRVISILCDGERVIVRIADQPDGESTRGPAWLLAIQISKTAEGGMDYYPREFSPQARARVEAGRLKAGKQLEQRMSQAPSFAGQEILRNYILRVFLVFAKEAFKLGSEGLWTVDEVRSEVAEFLRRFTIEAYYGKGHGKGLPEMTSHWNGSILPEVQREFERSAEWREFEDGLLAVAEAIGGERKAEPRQGPSAQTRATAAPAPPSGPVDRRAAVDAYIEEVSKKTGQRITRTDIWKTARYKSRTEFERWERNDPKKPNKSAHQRFTQILDEKPHLK